MRPCVRFVTAAHSEVAVLREPVLDDQSLDGVEMLVRGQEYETVHSCDGGDQHVEGRDRATLAAQLRPEPSELDRRPGVELPNPDLAEQRFQTRAVGSHLRAVE